MKAFKVQILILLTIELNFKKIFFFIKYLKSHKFQNNTFKKVNIHLFAINKLNNENKVTETHTRAHFSSNFVFYSPHNRIGMENYLINCIVIVIGIY